MIVVITLQVNIFLGADFKAIINFDGIEYKMCSHKINVTIYLIKCPIFLLFICAVINIVLT